MQRHLIPLVLVLGLVIGTVVSSPADAGEHRLGFGIHYYRLLDGVDDLVDASDIEDDGFSYLATYQYVPRGFFKFQIDLERFTDGFGGTPDTAWSPQFFVLVGGTIYGGLGVGVTYSSDTDFSDPFFLGRLGLDFVLLGSIHLDIGATYFFNDWDAVEDFDFGENSFTVGAAIRVGL